MARARNIKPAFFTNDELVSLPFEYRLLFIGVWTLADREGRLEDRPVKIKMEVFPADNVDVNAGLQALHDSGFIQRYQADGKRYIQVTAWAKHQNPHCKEASSTIPAPCSHGASTIQPPEIPERAGLIPDSGFLIHTEANASAAGAAPESPPDPIWGTGLAYLLRSGIPEKQARSLLGKLRQACGDVETGALLAQAEADAISDPAPWLMAAASRRRARAGPNGAQPMGKQMQGVMALEAMKRERLAGSGNPGGAATAGLLVAGSDPGG